MPMMPPRKGKSLKKEKLNFNSLAKIFKYIKRYSFPLIVSIIFAIGSSICTIIGPDRVSDLVNDITKAIYYKGSITFEEILKTSLILLSIYLASAVMGYIQQFITATITQKTSKNFRTDINNKLNKLPLSYFDHNSKGDILSKVTNDVDTISQTLSTSIANLVSSVVLFIGVIIMMFKTNWILALITIGTSLIGLIVSPLLVKKSQKYFDNKQINLGKMNGQIEEVYTNHNIVRNFNACDDEIEVFEDTNKKLHLCNWKSQFLSGIMMPVMIFVGDLSYVSIFVFGSLIYLNNKSIDLGVITSFIIYAKLFSSPLQTFAQSITNFQQASAASDRVFSILEETEMSDETKLNGDIPVVKGNIEFRNVKFGYFENKEIIHGFSASIKSGQKIAIVGPTGAGKTTIVNLLMKFYEVNSGDIIIDGVSIKDMKREKIHDLFEMILQDTWLFKGTLRDNLVFNKKDISDEKLNEVCKSVGLEHYVKSLALGYDTQISEFSNLSEGQRQQITIARAIIKESPLLILDEATSSVDTRTELIVQRAMDKLTRGRTSFIIAHRLSTIRNADLILVLKDGDIIEQGNHENLLKKKTFYSELYNSQFQKV